MAKMKEYRKYYFTVEGETEQWYLQWLQNQINTEPASTYKVTLDCPKQKDPVKRAKTLIVTGKTDITHIFDYESDEDVHTTQFQTALDRMKDEFDAISFLHTFKSEFYLTMILSDI